MKSFTALLGASLVSITAAIVGCGTSGSDAQGQSASAEETADQPADGGLVLTEETCKSTPYKADDADDGVDPVLDEALQRFEVDHPDAYERCRKFRVEQAAQADRAQGAPPNFHSPEWIYWANLDDINAAYQPAAGETPPPAEEAPPPPPPPAGEPEAIVQVTVHTGPLGTEWLSAEGGDLHIPRAPVSTGRAGHRTPRGCFWAFKADKWHKSSLYPPPNGGAPMTDAVFFAPSVALHVGSVGVASHGCVHVSRSLGDALFDSYQIHPANFRVCVE